LPELPDSAAVAELGDEPPMAAAVATVVGVGPAPLLKSWIFSFTVDELEPRPVTTTLLDDMRPDEAPPSLPALVSPLPNDESDGSLRRRRRKL
jgi:hypothetical protein